MKHEIDALEPNGTWEPTDLPAGRKAVVSNEIIRLNSNQMVLLIDIKPVLSLKVIINIDFFDTFSPMAKL